MLNGYYRIDLWEIFLLVFYVVAILFGGYVVKKNNINKNPSYKYYPIGLMIKVFGAVTLCFIYTFYYSGGDSTCYFDSGLAFSNMLMQNPANYFKLMFSPASLENYFLFNPDTNYPWQYMYFDEKTLFVIKLISPIIFISGNSYLLSSVTLSFIAFSGSWRLYQVFYKIFPRFEKECAIGILFIPSVAFWGSGILKDTITLSASGWLVYGFFNGIVIRKKMMANIIIIFICSYLIVSIKPYILMALLPGTLVWAFSEKIQNIRNKLVRLLIIPFIYALCILIAILTISVFGDKLGKFSPEKIIETAIITQQDLKDDHYHGNAFDIGYYDPTPIGILSKFPIATMAGLYMPFLWQVKNVVMLLSAIENLFILFLSVFVIFSLRTRLFIELVKNPILLFSLSYAVFFAFFVGFSTANFGALVRFKIAYLPFFVTCLMVLSSWKKKINSPKYVVATSRLKPSYPPMNN